MSGRERKRGFRTLALLAGLAMVIWRRRKSVSGSTPTWLQSFFPDLTEAVDRKVGWDKLPVPLALVTFIGLRMRLRERNLSYPATPTRTTALTPLATPAAAPADGAEAGEGAEGYLAARTPDGTYNDLNNPHMGSAGTRFGRNIPLQDGYPDP